MGTNCAFLVADLFCSVMREASCCLCRRINSPMLLKLSILLLSRYLDDLLNIDNNFFDSMINHIYPSELQLNKTNVSDTEASFLDYIYLYRMVLLRLKYMMNEMILILILRIFHFYMVMFLVRHPMVFIFLNFFDLLECPVMLMS